MHKESSIINDSIKWCKRVFGGVSCGRNVVAVTAETNVNWIRMKVDVKTPSTAWERGRFGLGGLSNDHWKQDV